MKPAPFAYVCAQTLAEAHEALAAEGGDASVIAGGQTLVPLLSMRMARPKVLVDIMRIPALGAIALQDDSIRVGAAVRQAELLAWRELQRQPLLALVLPWVGHPQTRSRGTICGSVALADPSAEIPLALLALEGEIELSARRGRRRVRAQEFFTGLMSTARQDDEMIEAVVFPLRKPGHGYAFREFARRHGDFAIVACAAVAHAGGVRLAVGGVADRPVVRELGDIDGGALDSALNDFAWDLEACDDLHATARYRRELVRRMGRETIEEARRHRVSPPPLAGEADERSSPGGGRHSYLLPTPSRHAGEKATGRARETNASMSAAARHPVRFELNGRPIAGEAEPRMLLTDFLRHALGMTGTHVGCEHGVCGACTIEIDGVPARACLALAVQVDGARLRTVEGLAPGPDRLSVLQAAFRRHHALQCGFCTPGILMSLDHYLRAHPDPDEASVREFLGGHLCRCTGYVPIVAAALDAARSLGEGAPPLSIGGAGG